MWSTGSMESESTMTPTQCDTLHREHRDWRAENDLWRDQLRTWEYELYLVKTEAATLVEKLGRFEQDLATLASAIHSDNEQLSRHEHELSLCAANPTNVAAINPSLEHVREAKRHAEQQIKYEAAKACHCNVMIHWKSLMKALSGIA
jgi:chromosome segregation ATPase